MTIVSMVTGELILVKAVPSVTVIQWAHLTLTVMM